MAYTPYGQSQQSGQVASYDVNGNLVGYTTPNAAAAPTGYYGAAAYQTQPDTGASNGYYQDPAAASGQPQTQMYMDPRTGQYYAVPITPASTGGYTAYGNAQEATPTNIELTGGLYGSTANSSSKHNIAFNNNAGGYAGHGYADPGPQPDAPITVSTAPISTHNGHSSGNNGNLTYAPPTAHGGHAHSSPAAVSPQPQPAIAPSQPAIAYVDNGHQPHQAQPAASPNVFHAATVTVTRPDTSRAHHDDSGTFWGHVKANVLGLDAMQNSKDNFRAAAQRNPKLVQDEEDKEAAEEHQSLENIPTSISPAELIKPAGLAIYWYFTFLQYLFYVNIFLIVIGLINFIPHMAKGGYNAGYKMFYLSSYDKSVRPYWFISSIISIVFVFFIGPLWRRRIDAFKRKRTNGELTYEDPFEGQYKIDTGDCIDKIQYPGGTPTRSERACRQAISGVAFFAVLVAQGVVNYYGYSKLHDLSSGTAAVVASLILKVINQLWKFVCVWLTEFEKHVYLSEMRRWECFKVFTFKILNVIVLFAVERLFTNQQDGITCPLESEGDQFVILVLTDIASGAALQIIYPWLAIKCFKSEAERSEGSNDSTLPPFNTSDEYVDVLYRQFLVAVGMFFVPLLPVLCLAAALFEYQLDKYRMLRLSQKPRRTNNSFRSAILFFFFLIGIGVIVGWPFGAIFALRGTAGLENCAFFQD